LPRNAAVTEAADTAAMAGAVRWNAALAVVAEAADTVAISGLAGVLACSRRGNAPTRPFSTEGLS
jgi:hypothetical protein